MLFLRAAARAERVHQAMLCRGFSGKFYSLQEFHVDRQSWIFSILMLIYIVGLSIIEWSNLI
jgi:cobalt/nickel transport system permease protein